MTTLIQRSFSSGELAPALGARVDHVRYATGLRTCRNAYPMRHGGVTNRPGTEFVCEVKDSTKRVRFIPFVFNSSQTYLLEFGDQYMRIIQDGGQITLSAQNITGITNANPAVVTYNGSDTYANGDEVYITGVAGTLGTYVNGRNFKVASVNTGANTFQLTYLDGTNVNSTSWGSYTSGGTVAEVYTISTPYLEADLDELQFVQSADVITIVHPSYAPRNLSRASSTSWSLSTITFAPVIQPPTNLTIGTGSSGGDSIYVVTSVGADGEESLASSTLGFSGTPTSGSPFTFNWTAASGAISYNVYKDLNGVKGFIGVSGSTFFTDTGYTSDFENTPPAARNPFGSTDNYPSAVGYVQQRQVYANTNSDPETVWGSRTGLFKNFTISSPLQDDDAVTFTMSGRQVNQVKHLIDLGELIVFTTAGEWAVEGDSSGIIKPTAINPKQHSYNGSGTLAPLIVAETALYVQARGSIVRDLLFDYQTEGYRGNDLTLFSTHLFEGYTLVDWTYQQVPNSIVWAVRSDGKLLALTYVREQQVLGWSRHDFDGTVENVCSIPEGQEDAVYLLIKRTINGATKRYIERFTSRQITDVVDGVFMDCALSFDGRNTTGSHTMTLSGGTLWDYLETLTLTSSASFFTSASVGEQIHLTSADGDLVRFTIEAYSSATVVTGRADRSIPSGLQSVATSDWTRAIQTLTGAWHIEDQDVAILGDGFVVGSPNNEDYDVYTVTNGQLTLDRPYGVIHVGIPYLSDIETLNPDSVQSETLTGKKKFVGRVHAALEAARGLWVGAKAPTDDADDPLEGLEELRIREDESYDEPVELATRDVSITIRPEWNSNGRVFMRQVDPLPLTVLAVAPDGYFPFRGAGG